MLPDHLIPVLFLAVAGLLAAGGMLAAAHILGPRRDTPVKQMPYESGMDPVGDARGRFDIRYYLVAIVFLIFDVELLFLYPWAAAAWEEQPAGLAGAVSRGELPGVNFVFGEVILFMVLLAAAYAYAWRKRVFDWKS